MHQLYFLTYIYTLYTFYLARKQRSFVAFKRNDEAVDDEYEHRDSTMKKRIFSSVTTKTYIHTHTHIRTHEHTQAAIPNI